MHPLVACTIETEHSATTTYEYEMIFNIGLLRLCPPNGQLLVVHQPCRMYEESTYKAWAHTSMHLLAGDAVNKSIRGTFMEAYKR